MDSERKTIVFRFNLKAYREKNGLTQNALAERLGMNQSMVSYYERHWKTLKQSTILQMATTLGINPMELYTDAEGVSAAEYGFEIVL